MIVHIHLGEPFWRTAGGRDHEIALPDGATVAAALEALARLHPALTPELDGSEVAPALFVRDQVAEPASPLADGDNLHILWPISGGAC